MSKQMLILELCCPQCQAQLTEGTKLPLNAFLREAQREGEMRLSAIFGDYAVESDVEVASGDLVEFRCPKCEASLTIAQTCKLCNAPMASLNLRAGGYLEFCCRAGCKGHALGGVGDIDEMMRMMNSMFETPYD
jgi:hypothetical protein